MNREQAIMTVERYSTFIIGDILVLNDEGKSASISPEQICAGVMLCDLMDTHNIKVEDLWANDHPKVQQICRHFVKGLLDMRTTYEHMVWEPMRGSYGYSL